MNFIADTLLLCGTKVNRENPQETAASKNMSCANGWQPLKDEISTDYDRETVCKDGKVRKKSVDKRGSMW